MIKKLYKNERKVFLPENKKMSIRAFGYHLSNNGRSLHAFSLT